MTGKRPRPLRRTSSESLIESESLTHESSPLSEHPKEKLKPTLQETVPATPRLVIGFHLKPQPETGNGANRNACSKFSSQASKRSPVQRSGLESLLSMPRERKVKNGVGLAIVAAMDSDPQEKPKANIVDRRNQRDYVAIAIKADPILTSKPCCTAPPYLPQLQTQSIPIHAPGSSSWHKSGRPSQHRFSGGTQPLTGARVQGGRAMLAWMQQTDREGERDTFLLQTSSTKSQVAVRDAALASPAVHFLDACYFCKRHLADGKDIYMYRGDKAFCSIECRTQQMLLDERHDNCAVAAMKTTTGGSPSRRNRVVAAGTAAAA